jgi:hypothetical protein
MMPDDISPSRFAVACHGGSLQAWQSECVRQLIDGAGATFVSTIDVAGTDVPSPAIAPLFAPRSQRYAPEDPIVRDAVHVGDGDAARLAALDLDFILCASGQDAPRLAALAGCPGWHFRFGGPARGAAPPGFWECYNAESVALAELLETTPDGLTSILRSGAVAVAPTSLAASVDCLLDEAARWAAIESKRFSDRTRQRRPSSAKSDCGRSGEAVGVFAALLLALKIGARRSARIFDVFFADKWNVGIARAPIDSFLLGGRSPQIDWAPEAGGLDYRADPFGAVDEGRTWVLAERFDARSGSGRIEAVEVGADGWRDRWTTVMTSSGHMSYPFVVEHPPDVYCIPEMLGQRSIALYRGNAPPTGWERAATLCDGTAAVDSTVFRHGGRWWLFCTDFAEPRHHRLHAFYAEAITGPYTPHAGNPVKIDPRSAGCAGTPFVVDGALYRPSQDCSRTYGGSVTINRIAELTPDTFVEEAVARVLPTGRYPAGIHTISKLGDRTLVDGKRRAFTLRRLFWRLRRALRPS